MFKYRSTLNLDERIANIDGQLTYERPPQPGHDELVKGRIDDFFVA